MSRLKNLHIVRCNGAGRLPMMLDQTRLTREHAKEGHAKKKGRPFGRPLICCE